MSLVWVNITSTGSHEKALRQQGVSTLTFRVGFSGV